MHNNQLTKASLLAAIAMFFAANPAAAYIGPGASAGTIAVVLGVLAAIVMAFFAILYYPIKRMLKKRKSGSGTPTAGE
jgi:hypothetical protein